VSGSAPHVPRADRFYGALGRNVVRFRWVVVALWIVAIVVTARLPSLSSEINNDNSQFLPASTPSSRAANLATPIFGSFNDSSNVTIVGATSGGPIDGADIAALTRVAGAVHSLAHVTSVRELAVSADGRAVQILVRARINFADITRQKTLLDSIQKAIAAAHPPPGFAVEVAGPVATNVANQNQSQKTGSQVQTFSLIFIVLLLLVIFRSALAPLITLLPAGISLLIATRLIGELGAHGLKISEITELLLIILLLGAGTDYGLFLVFRVREEIRRGAEPREAVERAVVRVGESITASAGTVILALLSLLLASFGIYHDLGIPLAIGVCVILLAGLDAAAGAARDLWACGILADAPARGRAS
jgi:RND superfamily putative drug exporter